MGNRALHTHEGKKSTSQTAGTNEQELGVPRIWFRTTAIPITFVVRPRCDWAHPITMWI